MANTTTSTTATSFTKTPQATDDSYFYDEDDFSEDGIYHDGIVSLDVTSNDLGGAAKTLYSVSDGDGNPLTADFTLQSKDTLTNGTSGWERTFKGNWMRINQGKIDYALGTSSDIGGPSLTPIRIDALNEGQVFSDSFVVSIRLGNGTLSQASVAIEITGKNDLATITPNTANSDYVVTEAGGVANGTTGDSSASGQLTIVDLDAGQSVFQPVAANSLVGSYGSFIFNSASGAWNYTLDNNNPFIEALNTNSAPLTDSLIVTSLDGTANHTITVTINGTNDAPVISGTAIGSATEDTTLSATGTLTSTDVDADATATWSIQGPSAGTYGSLALDGNTGKWTYSLTNGTNGTTAATQSLAEGESHDEIFTVRVTDDQDGFDDQTVIITVTGTNDRPTLTITDTTGVMNEGNGAATLNDSGALSVVDIDNGDVITVSESYNNDFVFSGGILAPALQAALVAGFSVDHNSWDYSASENLDFLTADETISFSFNVVVTDDSGAANAASAVQKVTITINGTNDSPVISGTAVGIAMEDTTLSATGTLTSTDVDANATATWSIQGGSAGAYGSLSLDGNTGEWTYSLTNGTNGAAGATQSLAEGESHDETFTVRVTDDQGGFDDQTVTITVSGTNDRPTLTIAVTTGVMNEGNGAVTLSDSGTLSFADIDNGDVITVSESYNNDFVFSGGILAPAMEAALIAGFSVDNNSWDYGASENLDFLSAGQTISFSFNVVATDDSGTANAASAVQKVTITINGTNDVAVLGNAVVSLNETNAPLTTGGTLTNSDVDNDDTFVAQVNKVGTNGTFSITTAGAWTYTANSAFNSLNIGSSVSDTFSVAAVDGTLTSVSVTINGTNDIPVISGETSGDRTVKEESDLSASGTLSIVDADAGQSEFAAGAGNTNYGNYTLGSNGVWSYTLDNANATVQGLAEGAQITDSFVAVSEDGITSKAVMITITGTGEGPAVAPAVYNGADPNDNDNVDSAPASAAVNFSGTGNIQDTVHGSNFADTIIGNNGADTIYGNGGNDFLSGGNQGDSIYGGSGVDTISGGDQADMLYGGSGDDVITGNVQADDIFGGSGNDKINGNENTDLLVGGFGSDLLTGGTGTDTFRYLDVRDTGDTITDFSGIGGEGDKIDLSTIDANSDVDGNNAFVFGGETTTLSANSVIWFVNNNGTAGNTADDFTVVQLDTDGDIGTAEMQINLTGVAPLVAGDFIL